MTKNQQNVKQFMQFFNQDCPEKPTQLTEDIAKLRAALILEEVLETITKGLGLQIVISQGNGDDGDSVVINDYNLKKNVISFHKKKDVDLVELADGIADINYVSEGTAVAAGIDMETIHEEVHNSNMSKAWREGDVEKAKELYPTARLEDYGGGLYRLIREDGKVIKSSSYFSADIKKYLE